jgi:hypothetical protein
MAFSKTRQFGSWIADEMGKPSIPGLLVHGLVFVILLFLLRMLIGRGSGYRDEQDDENNKRFQANRFVN